MSIPEEEARRFLPREKGASHAFDAVNAMHFRATSSLEHFLSLPQETQEMVVDDYLRAAWIYFANNARDPYLDEMGTTAEREVNMNMTPDPAKFVNRKFVPDSPQGGKDPRLPKGENQGLVIVFDKAENTVKSAVLVVSPRFAISARNNPLGVLAGFVYQLSSIRDVVNHDPNGPQLRQRDIDTRADVLEAQFWFGAQRDEQGIALTDRAQRLRSTYRRGSQDMPARLRYQGKHHPRG